MRDPEGQRRAGEARGEAGETRGPGVVDPLARAAARWPGGLALEDPAGSRTYRELDAAATALADLLRGAAEAGGPDAEAIGADAGRAADAADRGPAVAFLLPRGPAAVVCLHAAPRAGVAAAPLHPGWTEPELTAYLERLRPAALACDPATRERAQAILPPGASLLELGEGWPPAEGAVLARGGAGSKADPRRAGDTGAAERRAAGSRGGGPAGSPLHTILSTSGSSGRPKAAGLTLANHLACARATERRMLLGPDDRWLASLSPAHVGGVALVLRAAWSGAALVLREGFDAGEVARLIEDGRVTHASFVPTMLSRIVEARSARPAPLTLRGILLGGDAAAPGRVAAALELDYPLFPTYGLTEAASQVATARPEEAVRWPDTVGRPLDGTEVRIGDADEILVRGPTVMAGYLWEPGPPGEGRGPWRTPDGWLRTGDAGRLGEGGRLWVTGRLSDRIISGGVTVDPAEVEEALGAHPAVREAAVVGLPDPEWGQRVAAAVVPVDAGGAGPGGAGTDSGGGADSAATARLEAALDAHCRERLAPAKRPRRLSIVDRLPRNPNGKVDRAAVRRLFG